MKFLFYFLGFSSTARTMRAAMSHVTPWLGDASPGTPVLPHPAVFCSSLHQCCRVWWGKVGLATADAPPVLPRSIAGFRNTRSPQQQVAERCSVPPVTATPPSPARCSAHTPRPTPGGHRRRVPPAAAFPRPASRPCPTIPPAPGRAPLHPRHPSPALSTLPGPIHPPCPGAGPAPSAPLRCLPGRVVPRPRAAPGPLQVRSRLRRSLRAPLLPAPLRLLLPAPLLL